MAASVEHKRKLLQVKGLAVSINGNKILNRIDLDIDEGDRVGLYGRSGSGKSTLAWLLLGEAPPNAVTSGNATWLGQSDSVDLLDRAVNRTVIGNEIAIIPQNPFTSLNPSLKCGMQITEAIRVPDRTDNHTRCLQLLGKLNFTDPERIFDAWPHMLSGGELQRVVTAMCLINRPRLVITDECTSALDPATSSEVLEVIDDYCRTHRAALLMISHDPGTLGEMCSRFYSMEDGRITETYRPERHSSHGGTKRLHADSEVIFAMSAGMKRFEDTSKGNVITALDGVSFEIRRQQAIGIAGQSGSGKSTIARVMTGLEALDSGDMSFGGEGYLPRSITARKAVQMIFQDPFSSLYPHRSAGYCIEEALEIHTTLDKTARRQRAKELMRTVGLPVDLMVRSTRSLSGGERQRVQIARALAVEPEILICDECTNGLDPEVEARILALLDRLRKERGMALVFISHNMDLLRTLVEDLIVMSQGRIVERGMIHQVLDKPQHIATRNLVR